MTRVAIIAAMPGELKPLVRGWPHSTRGTIHFWAQRTEEEEWIAACAGAGLTPPPAPSPESKTAAPSISSSPSAGPAPSPPSRSRQAHNCAGVIDARTGERFNCDAGAGTLWLATSPRVADEPEKRRLATTYKAALVDMEAAAIARLAAMRGIPFYCIKGVSDPLDAKLPDFNRFIDARRPVPDPEVCSFCSPSALDMARTRPDGRK